MNNFRKFIFSLLTILAVTFFLGIFLENPIYIHASTPAGKKILVSIGDSYAAGEGIEPFFGQNKPSSEKVEDEDWLAHRSEKVWSGQLIINGQEMIRNDNWFFVASSGAKTFHLSDPQKKEYDYDGLKGSKDITPQIKVFDEIDQKYGKGSVDFVTVQIGGNDLGFVDLMKNAILSPNSLDEAIELIKYNFNNSHTFTDGNNTRTSKSTKDDIKNAYKLISDRAGKQATIIVAGYPRIMNPDGFKAASFFTVSKETSQKINDAVDYFNGELEKIVNECRSEGINIYYVSVTESFKGHEAGTEDAYINNVTLGKGDQDLKGSILSVSSSSLHPNDKGAAVFTKLVQAEINKHLPDSPEKPSLKLSTKKGVIILSWEKIEGASKYRIYQYINGKAKLIKKTKKTSYNLKNTVKGSKYTFILKAYVNGKWIKSSKQSINSK